MKQRIFVSAVAWGSVLVGRPLVELLNKSIEIPVDIATVIASALWGLVIFVLLTFLESR